MNRTTKSRRGNRSIRTVSTRRRATTPRRNPLAVIVQFLVTEVLSFAFGFLMEAMVLA